MKEKKAGDRKHITDGGDCWCNPTVENYREGEKQEKGYAVVDLGVSILRDMGLLPKGSEVIGAKWEPSTRSVHFYVCGLGLPFSPEGAMPIHMSPGDTNFPYNPNK